MWLPDVYQGSPTSVTLFMSTVPKIAYFALALRLLAHGLAGTAAEWSQMLTPLAVLTLIVGNVVAIAQTNIKRMLAYSTIGNVGFILLGFVAGTPSGYSGGTLYTLVYVLVVLGSFGVILLMSRTGFEADKLDDFKGLYAARPAPCDRHAAPHVLDCRGAPVRGVLGQAPGLSGALGDEPPPAWS